MLKKIKALPLHTHFTIRTASVVAGMILFLLFRPSGPADTLNAGCIVGLILMVLGIFWHILFIRCPHCGNHFRLRGGIPKYCSSCGKYIDKYQ